MSLFKYLNRTGRILVFLGLLTILVFSNTFKNPFIWDDSSLIERNRFVQHTKYLPFLFNPQYWKIYHPGTKGQYRPVRTLTFMGDYHLWKENVVGYHVTNTIFHIANVFLVYFLVRLLFGKKKELKEKKFFEGFDDAAFLTALLFALHPIHVESVTWIKNRSDLLACMFFLISLLLFIKSRQYERKRPRFISYAGALLAFPVALCAKEMAISLPVVLVLYGLCWFRGKERLSIFLNTLPFFGIIGAYLMFKKMMFGTLVAMESPPPLSLYHNILVIFTTFSYYIRLLVLPIHLNAERLLFPPESFFSPEVFLSFIGLCGYFMISLRLYRRWPQLCFGLLWIFIALSPALNIIFLYSRPIAEQRLYIPSIGFCFVLGLVIQKMITLSAEKPVIKTVLVFAVLVVCVLYGGRSMLRNSDWKDPVEFWLKTIQGAPESARAYGNLGYQYSFLGQHEKAIEMYKEALRTDPYHVKSYNNLGVSYTDMGETEKAEMCYKEAIKIEPTYARVYANLGNLYFAQKEYVKAKNVFEKAVSIDPYYVAVYNNLGDTYVALGQVEKANAMIQKALSLDPDFAEGYTSLADIMSKKGNSDEAIALYEKAIEMDPKNVGAYNNLALLYTQMKKYKKAKDVFQKAIAINPDRAEVYNNFANLTYALGHYEEAVALYERAVRIDPDYAEANNNLASLYCVLERFEESIPLFKKSLEKNPDNIGVYYNLGNAYHALKNYKNAIAMFKKALDLGAKYINVQTQLGRVYQDMGKTIEAKNAYEAAIEYNATDIPAYHGLITLLIDEKEYADAVKYYDIAKDYGYNNPVVDAALAPYRDE